MAYLLKSSFWKASYTSQPVPWPFHAFPWRGSVTIWLKDAEGMAAHLRVDMHNFMQHLHVFQPMIFSRLWKTTSFTQRSASCQSILKWLIVVASLLPLQCLTALNSSHWIDSGSFSADNPGKSCNSRCSPLREMLGSLLWLPALMLREVSSLVHLLSGVEQRYSKPSPGFGVVAAPAAPFRESLASLRKGSCL